MISTVMFEINLKGELGNGMFIGDICDICRRRVLMTYSNGYLHVMSAHATTEHTTPPTTHHKIHIHMHRHHDQDRGKKRVNDY
jgi:hypothetical protein